MSGSRNGGGTEQANGRQVHRCSRCGSSKHNSRTCPSRVDLTFGERPRPDGVPIERAGANGEYQGRGVVSEAPSIARKPEWVEHEIPVAGLWDVSFRIRGGARYVVIRVER